MSERSRADETGRPAGQVVGVYTGPSVVAHLVAWVAAFVGMVTATGWLASAGFFAVVVVMGWTVVTARRRPDLVAEAERNERSPTRPLRSDD